MSKIVSTLLAWLSPDSGKIANLLFLVLLGGIIFPANVRSQELEKGLEFVPLKAVGFFHLRVGEMLQGDAGKALLEKIKADPTLGHALTASDGALGISVDQIESITLVVLPPRIPTGTRLGDPRILQERFAPLPEMNPLSQVWVDLVPATIITVKNGYDRGRILAKITESFTNQPGVTDHKARMAILCLSKNSFMAGMPGTLIRYSEMIAAEKSKNGPLSVLLAQAKGNSLCLGVRLPDEMKQLIAGLANFEDRHQGGPISLFASFYPLISQPVALTAKFGNPTSIQVKTFASNEKSAVLGEEVLRTAQEFLGQQLKKLTQADLAAMNLELLEDLILDLRKSLAGAEVSRDGNKVIMDLNMTMNPEKMQKLVARLATEMQQQTLRVQSLNNLKMLMLAMHNIHDVNNGFPPAGVGDVRGFNPGKPLLSWRVHLLPYLEQENLYKQFRLDLPWDHPHNKKLIEKMPKVFAPIGKAGKPGLTHYQVLVGPGTVFEPNPGVRRMVNRRITEISDGTSNTIAIVEADNPVIWTKPDDVPYDPQNPLPKLGGMFRGGFHAAFADGSVHFIPNSVKEDVLRALISRNGGEVIPEETRILIWPRDPRQREFPRSEKKEPERKEIEKKDFQLK